VIAAVLLLLLSVSLVSILVAFPSDGVFGFISPINYVVFGFVMAGVGGGKAVESAYTTASSSFSVSSESP